jgi:TMEM175 potassium channel family protein
VASASYRKRLYQRGGEEFGRVLAFTDGLYAIAMTLLIVGIAVPTLKQGDSVSELADALNDLIPNFVSFFISFTVIGRYWIAHHQQFSMLRAMDVGLIGINLFYLMFVAFLPFPTALLGEYFDNPLSIVIYAVNVGLVSALEVVMFRHAQRHRLLDRTLPEDVYRYGMLLSLSPVVFFGLSIPVAFAFSSVWAVAVWFLGVPLQVVAGRWKPEGADELLA